MGWRTISDVEEGAICFWKYCLSFRKRDWTVDDYPIRIRKNQPPGPDVYARFREVKADKYIAQIMKWWILSGGGDSPRLARAALVEAFNSAKADRLQQGKPLPRPGTSVLIDFAPQDRVNRDPGLQEDFVRRVIGVDWAWLSDQSSLWDFHAEETRDSMIRKVREIYGVDISDIESGNIAQILERIAASQ